MSEAAEPDEPAVEAQGAADAARSWTTAHFWEVAFVAVAAVIGVALLLIMPPLTTPDERAHFARVSTVANGWFVPPLTKGDAPEFRLEGCATSFLFSPRGAHKPWRDRFTNPNGCGHARVVRNAVPAIRRTEAYPPVAYLPAVIGYRLGRAVLGITGAFYGARIAQLVAWIALTALAIRIAPFGKSLLFALALLPVLLQSAIGLSADPITTSFAFLVIAQTVRLMHRAHTHRPPVSRAALVGLGATCLTLAVAKSSYLPVVALIAAIPTSAFGTVRRRLVFLASAAGTALTAAAAWSVLVTAHIQTTSRPDAAAANVLGDVRADPLGFLRGIWNAWSYPAERTAAIKGLVIPEFRLVEAPTVSMWLVALVVVVVVVVRLTDPPPRRLAVAPDRTITASMTRRERALTATIVGGVVGATYLLVELGLRMVGSTYLGVRTGFQGRYLLPLVPVVLVGATARRFRWERALRIALPTCSVALLTWWCWVSWFHYNVA